MKHKSSDELWRDLHRPDLPAYVHIFALVHLTLVACNIAYVDQTRTVQSTAVTVSVVECHTASFSSRHSYSQSPTTSKPGRPAVCFYCTKQGHVRERYFLRLAQLRKEEQQAPTSKPELVPRSRKIDGVVSGLSPRTEAQVGKLRLPVLLDSG
jgi:hypothetical protein